ncbi:MAG: transglutaminase-like domain-containing protein, partial [Bacteroidales bacterium]
MKILKNKVARQLEDASAPRAAQTCFLARICIQAQTCFLLLASLLLFASCSTFTQRQALDYLYEYMPLNDRAEQSREYFQKAVSQAFRTKDMPWGKTVPQDLFKHYVLPPRVNNEYLDNARQEFYKELYPRVKNLSMYQAVLEVNHWCREKVEYRPTDIRTTAPLQTVARGYGRCGEESVVAVSALRSIGIPARQVYAPRWSHTNDNHAWVEVWVDGRW